MSKLKASIKPEEQLSGSIVNQYSLTGSIQKIIKLIGSVDSFVRSLSMKIFVYPVVNIYSKANIIRRGKTNLIPMVNILARIKGFKNSRTNTFPHVSVIANARANRNAKSEILFKPIFGKDTTLGIMDSMKLEDLDSLLLSEIEFFEGVFVSVAKKAKVNLYPKVEIVVSAYTVSYTKLEALDTQLLEDLDVSTLEFLEEVIV